MNNHKLFLLTVFGVFLSLPAYCQTNNTPNLNNNLEDNKEIIFQPLQPSEDFLPDLPLLNQNLTIMDAVNISLTNNAEVNLAKTEVGIRKTSISMAKAKYWPNIFLGSLTFARAGDSLTLMNPETMMNMGDSDVFQDFNATMRFPIFTGGQLRGGVKAAKFSFSVSEAEVNRSLVDTASLVRQNYLNSLLINETIKVYNEQIDVQNQLLNNTELKYKVGSTVLADVLRVKSAIANLNQELNSEEIKLSNSMFELKAAMGINMSSNITLVDPVSFTAWNRPELNQLTETALSTHPKIIAAQNEIKVAQSYLKATKGKYFPQVYGQVTGNLRVPHDPPMMGNGAIGMLTVSLPVLDRSRDTEISNLHAILSKTQQQLKVIQIRIIKEIAQLWNEKEISQKNISLTEATVAQAQEDYRIVSKRYDVGKSILVEVQDALSQLQQAKLNRIKALVDYELVKTKLMQSVGLVSFEEVSKNIE